MYLTNKTYVTSHKTQNFSGKIFLKVILSEKTPYPMKKFLKKFFDKPIFKKNPYTPRKYIGKNFWKP